MGVKYGVEDAPPLSGEVTRGTALTQLRAPTRVNARRCEGNVMPGLDAGIHFLRKKSRSEEDGLPVKPGNDAGRDCPHRRAM